MIPRKDTGWQATSGTGRRPSITSNKFNREQAYLIDELWEQLDNLRVHADAFDSGQYAIYKSMSSTLRLVLVGSKGQPGLVTEVLPRAGFLPLRKTIVRGPSKGIISPADVIVTNDAGGKLHLSGGSVVNYLGIEDGGIVLSRKEPVSGDVVRRTSVGNLFNYKGALMRLNEWLGQPFLRREWTLRDFINNVANKDGGAHIRKDSQLTVMQDFGDIHRHLTAKLAKYVAATVSQQLKATYPSHKRIER